MSNIAPHPLLAKVDAHCAKTGLSKSAFGERALGDPSFVFDLEAGREPRRRTVERVQEFMRTDSAIQPRRPRSGKTVTGGVA